MGTNIALARPATCATTPALDLAAPLSEAFTHARQSP